MVERVQLVPTKPPAKVRRMEDGRIGVGKVRVRDWGRPCRRSIEDERKDGREVCELGREGEGEVELDERRGKG